MFGDEASFAQWGSLSYTWRAKCNSEGLQNHGVDRFPVRDFLHKAHTGWFNLETYQAFLLEVLAKISQRLIIIQDDAHYHTSKAMEQFFTQYSDRITMYQNCLAIYKNSTR